MVYYVTNSEGKNLAEIEIYWAEGYFDPDIQKYAYDLDCHSYFYMKNFLPEFKDRSDYMTEATIQKFIEDIDDIAEFRGYVKEKLLVGVEIDSFHLNSKKSQEAKKLVSDAAETLLDTFCKKYGFYLVED